MGRASSSFAGAFADLTPMDKANAQFWAIIEEEKLNNVGGGDHFAKPGANDRIWNALEKLCLRDPAVFAAYYGNAVIALVSEAWLGAAYQITSQLNVVNPGGAAQVAHRDYHLGFQSAEAIERFPVHVHRLSPMLTLQGAIAHCDMPLETGPTLYLPFSQSYLPGYMATAQPEFRDYFDNASCPAAARQGRRGVLQPGPLPRRGNEPLEGRAPYGQPVAGLLGLRPRDGERRSAQDELRALSGAAKGFSPIGRSRRPRRRTPSLRARKAIPSRPISTATRRKAAWRPRPSRT